MDKNLIVNETFFDTIKIKPRENMSEIKKRALEKQINLRYYEDGQHVRIKKTPYWVDKEIHHIRLDQGWSGVGRDREI